MLKVKELKGRYFTIPLKDKTVLHLRAGQSKTIKEDALSESLINAQTAGLVSVTKVKEIPKKVKEEKVNNTNDKESRGAK